MLDKQPSGQKLLPVNLYQYGPVSVSEGTDFGQKKIETMGLLVYGLNH